MLIGVAPAGAARRYRPSVRVGLIVAALIAWWSLPAVAAHSDHVEALSRMPRPWLEKPNTFTFEEYDATLRHWAEKRADVVSLSKRGESGDGFPLYLVDLTAKSIPDDDKQRILITGLHVGPERSGGTTILRLIEWLLGGDAEAREVLRKQRVLAMPVMNPHGMFAAEGNGNAAGLPVYDGRRGKMWDIAAMRLLEPEKTPELGAFVGVADEFQPEVHADVHGVTLSFNGQLVSESVGSAGSNHALRPWDSRVTEAMIAAGREAGYPSDRWEADAQRMLWGPELEPHAPKLWMGRVFFYPGSYPYMKYHTLPVLTENGWEEGGVARLKGLLRVGNTGSDFQPHPGYAVDRVKSLGGHYLAAYGRTAAERRASRVELWSRQGAITLAMLYPQCDCRALVACAVTPAGRSALVPRDPKTQALTAQGFIESMRALPEVDADAIETFVKAGPEVRLYADPTLQPAEDRGLEHGLAFLLRLSYAKPELLDLRLNGHLIKESAADGFQTWFADGFTNVQINVPPEKTRGADVFVVSCAYRPDVQRTYGWRPPAEVLSKIKAAQEGDRGP